MDYLNKVLIYLKQELPDNYKNCLKLVDTTFVFNFAVGVDFTNEYGELHQLITESIERIRKREIDLSFSVKSSYQERDFVILKK